MNLIGLCGSTRYLENLPTNVLRIVRPNGKEGQGEEREGRNQGQLMRW
jgi:hypothetical protein